MPDGWTLSAEQAEVVRKICASDHCLHRLKAFAGGGKTRVMLVLAWLVCSKTEDVFLLSPTRPACPWDYTGFAPGGAVSYAG